MSNCSSNRTPDFTFISQIRIETASSFKELKKTFVVKRGWLGSARVSRVGERVLAIANFSCGFVLHGLNDFKGKPVSARRPFGFAQDRLHQVAAATATRAAPITLRLFQQSVTIPVTDRPLPLSQQTCSVQSPRSPFESVQPALSPGRRELPFLAVAGPRSLPISPLYGAL